MGHRASIVRRPAAPRPRSPWLAASWWVPASPFISRRSLRLQPLQTPAIPAGPVNQPVMQPVVAPLPELEHLRPQQVAAPVVRQRHVLALEPGLVLGQALLEHGAAGDDA